MADYLKLTSRQNGDGIPEGWVINPEHGMMLKINDKKIGSLYINGKAVQSLYINGKLNYTSGITGAIAFTSRQDDSTIKIVWKGNETPTEVNLEYKIDDDWMPYTVGTQLNIAKGWTIYFRNTSGQFSKNETAWHSIIAKGGWDVAGELNALLDYRVQADTIPEYAFVKLFQTEGDEYETIVSDIVDASKLKIKFDTVGLYGLYNAFGECATMVKPPKKIDVKNVGQSGCGSMFSNCSSMESAPELPATNIGSACYG